MRLRLEAMARTIDRRIKQVLDGWISMLEALGAPTPPEFVDWLQVDRIESRDLDVGFHRHWVDPTLPFARALADHTQAIRINPNNNRAFNNRGQVYLRLQFWEEAVEDFTTAIDLAPSEREAVIALFNRGRAWEGLGEDADARADFELAHDLAPDDPDYREKFIEYGFIRP